MRDNIMDSKEIRLAAYEDYCNHVASGMTKESWSPTDPRFATHWQSMESCMKQFPDELDAEKMSCAKAKSLLHWEKVLGNCADGTNRKANPAALQMIMRNKFGWDKPVAPNEADMTLFHRLRDVLFPQPASESSS